jgi:hypothetical protein
MRIVVFGFSIPSFAAAGTAAARKTCATSALNVCALSGRWPRCQVPPLENFKLAENGPSEGKFKSFRSPFMGIHTHAKDGRKAIFIARLRRL